MRTTNKTISKGAALCVFVISAGALVAADSASAQPGLYAGGAYGQSRVNDSDFDDENTAMKIMVGGKFNRFLGLELAGNDYGESSGVGYESELKGITFAAVGYLPLGDSFELFVKGGNLWWEHNLELFNTFDDTIDGNEFFYGAGVNFNFTPMFALRAEMERYEFDLADDDAIINIDGKGTVDVVSLGVLFNF